jgi:hypothetical protein
MALTSLSFTLVLLPPHGVSFPMLCPSSLCPTLQRTGPTSKQWGMLFSLWWSGMTEGMGSGSSKRRVIKREGPSTPVQSICYSFSHCQTLPTKPLGVTTLLLWLSVATFTALQGLLYPSSDTCPRSADTIVVPTLSQCVVWPLARSFLSVLPLPLLNGH